MTRRPRTVAAPALVALFLAGLPAAQALEPRLLADLLPGQAAVGDFSAVYLPGTATLGGRTFFVARTRALGDELWSTDGTPEGTAVVRDLCPGRCFSDARSPVRAGEAIYFSARDPLETTVRRLFRTDGSVAGTWLVASADGGGLGIREPDGLTASGGRLFFLASLPTGEGPKQRLWSTDGTRAGTRPVAGLCEAGCAAQPFSRLVADGKGGLYFGFSSQGGPAALWHARANGPAVEIVAPPDGVREIAAEAGKAAFRTDQGELWIAGRAPGSGRRLAGDCAACLDLAVLAGPHPLATGGFAFVAAGGGFADALWSTDGTVGGSRRLHDRVGLAGIAFAYELVPTDERSFFTVGTAGGVQLWVTDGTADGTRRVALPPNPFPLGLSGDGDRVAFKGGRFFGTSDGTPGGTRVVVDTELPEELAAVGDVEAVPGGALFVGLSTAGASDPWWTDGTLGGTRRLTDHGTAPASTAPSHLTAVGDALLFAARDGERSEARQLWRSDSGGLTFLTDVDFAITSIGAGTSTLVAGPTSLLATDGTPVGTTLVSDQVGAYGPFARFAGRRYFAGSGDGGVELWSTDGTTAGTERVRDIDPTVDPIPNGPISGSSDPGGFVAVGGRLVFSAQVDFDRQLWTSDGSEEGTIPLTDLHPDALGALPAGSTQVPSRPRRAVFAATGDDRDRELWRTDGTAAGTRRLADLATGSSSPRGFARLAQRVLFFATQSNGTEALYRTDGTTKGTRRVTTLRLAGDPAHFSGEVLELAPDAEPWVVAAGGHLFFVVFHPTTGHELWVSDGTAAGTQLLLDLLPGPAGSDPGSLAVVDGKLVFAADDGVHGRELWVSDGTAEGTRLLADVAPGGASSNPTDAVAAGDLLAFVADDGAAGRELWGIDRADLDPALLPPSGD